MTNHTSLNPKPTSCAGSRLLTPPEQEALQAELRDLDQQIDAALSARELKFDISHYRTIECSDSK